MNTRPLTLDDRLHWEHPPSAPPVERDVQLLNEFLEVCILRCDDLCQALDEIGVANERSEVLGECVVACGQYMAAMSRDSYLESCYALLCAEVCGTAARLSAKLECDTALKCAAACHVCAGKIRSAYQHLPLN